MSLYAHVLMDTLVIQPYLVNYHPDLNVPLIQNAQITLHVLGKNAKIHASLARVESMQNVKSPDIELFVYVVQDMRVTLIGFAKSLAAKEMMNAH
jgi:hypothetical protein